MAFDTKQWLIDEMGFSAEQADALAPQFADRADRLQSGYLGKNAREKFAADQAALEAARADISARDERLNREMAEWATLTTKEKEAAQANLNALEAARMKVTQIETRLQAAAPQYGFDPNTILEGTAVVPPKVETPAPTVDTSKFIQREQIAPVIDYQMNLAATLQYLAEEHKELFGTRLDAREIVKEVQARAAKNNGDVDPEAIWKQKYGVDAKRAEVQQAKYNADIAAAEARGEERALTQRAMPGPADPGRHAPIFRNPEGQFAPRTSRLHRPQPGETARNAAAALATGKYRDSATRGAR